MYILLITDNAASSHSPSDNQSGSVSSSVAFSKSDKKFPNCLYKSSLAKRYPWLLPYNVWNGEFRDDYDYSYLWVEPERGWESVIFYPMMEEIRVAAKEDGIIDQLRTCDYKSKYGGLRFYILNATPSFFVAFSMGIVRLI